MARQPDNIQEWLERYEKKYQRAFDNYQASGDPKYDRQVWEYDCICEAFRALLEKKDAYKAGIDSRCKNRDWTISRLIKSTYSRDEVIELLHDAVYW